MRKRTLLSLMALAPVVSACGFRLRGAPSFPFKTLYVQAPEGSPFTREVLRNLATAGGNLTVVLPPAKPDTAEATLQLLGNGFIITAMLWAAALVALIERRPGVAVGLLFVAAVLSAFGVIHSTDPRGGIYLPWQLEGLRQAITLQVTAAYAVLAVVIGLMSLQKQR